VTKAISKAKEALDIRDIHGNIKNTRSLTDIDKERITALWQEQYNATDVNQFDIETIAPAVPLRTDNAITEEVETIPAPRPLHIDTTIIPVRINNVNIETAPAAIADDTSAPIVEKALELINAPLSELELLRIENSKLQARIAVIDAKHAPTFPDSQLVRLTVNGVQIALNGAYLNALMVATRIDKAKVKKWLESAVINPELNITEQVKLAIVTELKNQLIKSRG
jgi:hypothetical protein